MQPRIVKLSAPPKKPQKEFDFDATMGDAYKDFKMGKFIDEVMPKKGKHYFTPEEVQEFIKQATPIKGKHYFDGQKGERGEPGVSNIPGPAGKDGKDADEDIIVEKVLSRIPKPKDGNDGKDGQLPDLEAFKAEILAEIKKLSGKKMKVADVEELENRLNQLSMKVERNYGGHGGTVHNIKTTLVSGGTYNLASPYPILGEMEVYVGGGRLFFENDDFTTTQIGGNKVSQIILSSAAQADIAEGSTLNVRGK